MIRTFVLVFVLCMFALGCARSPGGVASSNIPVAPGSYTVLGSATGSDCKINLLGIIPISGGNDLSDALAEAKSDRPGTDALVEITVDSTSKYFILWSQMCTGVSATAVSVP